MKNRKALHRLGLDIVDCPMCSKAFRYQQPELHFVLFFIDGEVVDDSEQQHDITDPYCCFACAEKRAASLNETAPDNHSYVPWSNQDWDRL